MRRREVQNENGNRLLYYDFDSETGEEPTGEVPTADDAESASTASAADSSESEKSPSGSGG